MKWLLTGLFFLGMSTASAQDVYNPAANQLQIPSVKVGNTIYTDVVITVGQILAVGASYPDPGTASFNLETAYRQFLQNSETKTFNISGAVDGIGVTGSGSFTAGRPTGSQFEGRGALSKTTNYSMTLRSNGVSIPFSTSSTTFFDNNYHLLGSMGESYEVVTAYYGFPSSATPNDAGLLYQATIYRDSTKRLIEGSRTVTYSTTFESASTVVLTIIEIDKDNFGNTNFTSASRFRVGRDYSVTRLGDTGNDSSTFLAVTF